MKNLPWYKSETVWFNIAIGIVGVLELNLRLLQSDLGEHYGFVVIAVGAIGVFLRTTVKTPLK